jgi:hypothetical protein
VAKRHQKDESNLLMIEHTEAGSTAATGALKSSMGAATALETALAVTEAETNSSPPLKKSPVSPNSCFIAASLARKSDYILLVNKVWLMYK